MIKPHCQTKYIIPIFFVVDKRGERLLVQNPDIILADIMIVYKPVRWHQYASYGEFWKLLLFKFVLTTQQFP